MLILRIQATSFTQTFSKAYTSRECKEKRRLIFLSRITRTLPYANVHSNEARCYWKLIRAVNRQNPPNLIIKPVARICPYARQSLILNGNPKPVAYIPVERLSSRVALHFRLALHRSAPGNTRVLPPPKTLSHTHPPIAACRTQKHRRRSRVHVTCRPLSVRGVVNAGFPASYLKDPIIKS